MMYLYYYYRCTYLYLFTFMSFIVIHVVHKLYPNRYYLKFLKIFAVVYSILGVLEQYLKLYVYHIYYICWGLTCAYYNIVYNRYLYTVFNLYLWCRLLEEDNNITIIYVVKIVLNTANHIMQVGIFCTRFGRLYIRLIYVINNIMYNIVAR